MKQEDKELKPCMNNFCIAHDGTYPDTYCKKDATEYVRDCPKYLSREAIKTITQLVKENDELKSNVYIAEKALEYVIASSRIDNKKAQMWDELNKNVKKIEKKGMTKTIELNWILAILRTLKIHNKITFTEKYSNGKYIKHEFINNKWVDTESEQSIEKEIG